MCVGRAAPLRSRSVASGVPDTLHEALDVFVSVSVYEIWPAPALPTTTSKLPFRSAPLHGAADDWLVIVVFVVVTVLTVVTVCVTVTVFVDPHPAASTATSAPRATASAS